MLSESQFPISNPPGYPVYFHSNESSFGCPKELKKVRFKKVSEAALSMFGGSNPVGILETGGVYEVEKEVVGSFCTFYHLRDVIGTYNSVMFEQVR